MTHKRTVAILLFPGVELLDFAGPLEVFSSARLTTDFTTDRLMEVFTVAETLQPLRCANPLTVTPDYTLDQAPTFDILLAPGGFGTLSAVDRPALIDWIAARARTCELTTSVCTGSFLLAKAGLLSGRSATTHWASIDRLRTDSLDIDVRSDIRWIDAGDIITSAGVSAGIDMALYIVGRLYGKEAAVATARGMEYDHWV